jgi:hypothetical protein
MRPKAKIGIYDILNVRQTSKGFLLKCKHFCLSQLDTRGAKGRGGHRHLQIGRMLDIDLISEPPRPPRCMYPKCGILCGQRGRKRFIASLDLRMSHICPCTPCLSPPGYRSKVESHHFAHPRPKVMPPPPLREP